MRSLTVLFFDDNIPKSNNFILNIKTMIEKLKTFIAVVEQHSFAKAAKKLNLSRASVTRHIQELEDEFQVTLLIRSTRHLSLSEHGESFQQYALEMLSLHKEALDAIQQKQNRIEGNLKIGLPASILDRFTESLMAPIIHDYPGLSIEIIQGNHLHDLLSSQFDIVIHCGPLPDINAYYEKIADWQIILCAAPTYLKQHGTPRQVKALEKHVLLDHADNHTGCWRLKHETVAVNSRLRINSSTALRSLAEQGLGIAYLPSFTVAQAIECGTLKPLLPSSWRDPMAIYALYPEKKRHHKKIRIIVDTLKNALQKG
ncbi:MAG: hypothetical protein COV52_02410 [Gammaproteobacteria bacterium CG11_big_fil_rev_8_21_14_0_20_46_22]|nr:MAG: hypothetical protein COW05_08450 [Gammaproteobacteria bacterium CG12_big_fil_rev_8_21_14_0_65_46_12]PIR11633.1 MAG: hypothetical protein COV52_02410 [Gammaproteobacteria bacterium CG11_big_fil_rev_8_21_14_0_20_46_22]